MVLALLTVVVLAGCVGGDVAPGTQSSAETDAQTTDHATSEETPYETPTMGEIPTMSDQTKEVLDELRSKQDSLDGYQATVTERTVVQLSNGSEQTRVRKHRVWVRYTENGTFARLESWSPQNPDQRDIYVRNRTAATHYSADDDVYYIDENAGFEDDSETALFYPALHSTDSGHRLFDVPIDVVREENTISYEGTETVNGREAYALHLDGNPNGGNLASYASQTFWFDTETGLLLEWTAQKPHTDRMRNRTVSGGNAGDDPVYLGD